MSEQLSEAFVRAAHLAIALGARNINRLPGCWEYRLDDDWRIAINGHGADSLAFGQVNVPPYALYAECQNTPMAFIYPHGGTVIGNAEDALIDALKRAMERGLPA